MSDLHQQLDGYLSLRRQLGYRLEEHGRLLPDFVEFATIRGESTVHVETALMWAGQAQTDGRRARRLSMVRGLARHLTALDPATEVPPLGLLADGGARPTPHIFSEAETAQLMWAATRLTPASLATAIATLIGLMAATGLRSRETRLLDRQHVDLDAGQLTVWHSKQGRSRRLPLHDTTIRALADYAAGRDRAHPDPHVQAFFLDADGGRLSAPALAQAFRDVREAAQITSRAPGRAARLGDLRHTFAVATLLSWHQAGIDVQQQLPALSAYMGHVNPAQTYWYLQGTPELMALVAERLERSWEYAR
jgi:integrase